TAGVQTPAIGLTDRAATSICQGRPASPAGTLRSPRAAWHRAAGALLRRVPLYHRKGELRRILLRVVEHVVRDDALRFVVVLPAGVQIAVEAREVAARDLQPDPVAGRKIV